MTKKVNKFKSVILGLKISDFTLLFTFFKKYCRGQEHKDEKTI